MLNEVKSKNAALKEAVLSCNSDSCQDTILDDVVALSGMLKGEEAQLKCPPDYAEGATFNVTQEEMFQPMEVYFAKDKTLMKKIIREGEGYDFPKDTAKVKLFVESDSDGVASLAGYTPKVSEFTAGSGEVCTQEKGASLHRGPRSFCLASRRSSRGPLAGCP